MSNASTEMTVSTQQFDQEAQLPFVSVEKEPTVGGDGGLVQKMKERPLLIGLVGTFVLLVLSGTILGVALSSGGGGDSASLSSEVADSRLVAVLRKGEECPENVGAATHVILPSVSVRTSTGKCSANCTLTYKEPCSLSTLRPSGQKVLLSFGEADECWTQCYGKGVHVAHQLESLRAANNLDGVAFTLDSSQSSAAESFYTTATQELRATLPENALIVHIGQDSDLVKGTRFSNTIDTVGGLIDFLVVQYFDGVTRPGLEGLVGGAHASALDHYRRLAEGPFKSDSTKLVFGFCISSCSASKSNINSQTAAALVKELQGTYPCNGGISYWTGDTNSDSWSTSLKGDVVKAMGCSVEGVPSNIGNNSSNGSATVPVAKTQTPATDSPATKAPTTRAPETQAPPVLPTPVPTAAPPTPKPTPVPTKSIPGCGWVIPVHRPCTANPDCCTEGTRCYQQEAFKATCLSVCNYPPRCKLISS